MSDGGLPDWLLGLLTHGGAALLGSGAASLMNALTHRRRLTMDRWQALSQALHDERDTLRDRCQRQHRRIAELETAVWKLRQGVVALQAQVRDLDADAEPDYHLDGDLPHGHNHETEGDP